MNGLVIIGFEGLYFEVRCIKSLKLIYGGLLFENSVEGPFSMANSAQCNGRNVAWFNIMKGDDIYTVAFRLGEFSSSICSACTSSSSSCSSSSSSSSSECGGNPFKVISLNSLPKTEQVAEGGYLCLPSKGDEVVVFNDFVNHVDIFVGKCCDDKPCLHVFTAKINKKYQLISECQDVRLPCKIDGKLSTSSGARSDNNDLYVSFTPSLDMVKIHYRVD